MKAPDFRYERPGSLGDALALLTDDSVEATPIAGGQSLMPMMNFRMAAPEVLVDLGALTELQGISVSDGWLAIGAMTRYRDLAASEEVARHAPLMARALPHVAHPAIRNRGTLGGSVALADPAAEMPAVLLALGGEIVLHGPSGQRIVAADDFFTGLYQTAREENELVTAIRVPCAAEGARVGFHELARRHGDYAMAGCCVAASGDLSQVRIALFAVSDRPVRAAGAESVLAGSDGGAEALAGAVAALETLDFDGDINAAAETKRHLAGVALTRAWKEVTG